MWGWNGQSWWWFFVMPLSVVGFWALVIWVAALVIRGDRSSHRETPAPQAGPGGDAERIVADRFARGEIDVREYHRRLDVLRSDGTDKEVVS